MVRERAFMIVQLTPDSAGVEIGGATRNLGDPTGRFAESNN
jgi:hypothetical protein